MAHYVSRASCCFFHTELPVPSDVLSICRGMFPVVVWNPPPGKMDLYTRYDILFSNPRTGQSELLSTNVDTTYLNNYYVQSGHLGTPDEIFVQVSVT
jgi:hypothetical protein